MRPAGPGVGVSELFDVDGSVRRFALGVVVLWAEFEPDGMLRAVVAPQWNVETGTLDTTVTDGTAIAEFTSAGEVASVRPYP